MFRFYIILSIILIIFTNSINAENITKIHVLGNERVSDKTIILFSELDTDISVDSLTINDAIQKLYETNFFQDINISFNEGVLKIEVVENPIVQSIIINGIKKKNIKEELLKIISIKEKSSFVEDYANQDLNLIKNALKTSGYYFIDVKLTKELNDNNTINLFYDVDLGEKALIKKISFVGDKKFKDKKLSKAIVSETSKFWKFFSNKKYLDQNRINLDSRLLVNFYKNKGYYDIKVESTSVKYLDNNYFDLTFNINSGIKYYFNDFNLTLPTDYDLKHFEELTDLFVKVKGKKYSLELISDILKKVDNIALSKQYDFINASMTESVIDKNKINFEIVVSESEKYYVNKINILGNNITMEEVIRNQLIVDEGDAFNKILHNKSINNIKSKGFFSTVKYEIKDSSEQYKKDIDIYVEEKPTGEISMGAGFGTSGSQIGFTVKENNYMGKGVSVSTNLAISEENITGLFSVDTPNFRYTDKSLFTNIQSTITDRMSTFGYKTTLTGFSFGTRMEQYEDLFFSPTISTFYESLDTNQSASANKKKQEGTYLDTKFHYSLAYDKRNLKYEPTEGFRSVFSQSLPMISENYAIVNGYNFDKYHEFYDEMVGTFSFYGKAINSITGDDVRVSNRLFIPSRKLRGFERGKVGPLDGTDYIGGNYITAINASTTLPTFMQGLQNTDFMFFVDIANVWGVDYSQALNDSNKIRSSAGLAVDWFTPIGPLNFSLAQPISRKDTDQIEKFRFELGTTF